MSEQPPLNFDDPFSWALSGRVYSNWLRIVAPQFDLDPTKLVLGDALSTIVGDDSTCFTTVIANRLNPQIAIEGQRFLIERLDWEINTLELPKKIREKLKEVKQEISKLNWTNEEEFLRAKNIWTEGAKNFTQTQISNNNHLKEAKKYANDSFSILRNEWSKYIHR